MYTDDCTEETACHQNAEHVFICQYIAQYDVEVKGGEGRHTCELAGHVVRGHVTPSRVLPPAAVVSSCSTTDMKTKMVAAVYGSSVIG